MTARARSIKTIDELMKIGERRTGEETTAPMMRAIEQIVVGAAVRKSASDIHFEPDDKSLRIRMRIDGVLQPFMLVPKGSAGTLHRPG